MIKYKMTWLCGHETEEEVHQRDQGYQEDPEIAISGFQDTGKTLLCSSCSTENTKIKRKEKSDAPTNREE